MAQPSWPSLLRTELAHHARQYAEEEQLPFYESLGAPPTILFEPFEDGARHGNFLDASYAVICQHPSGSASFSRRIPGGKRFLRRSARRLVNWIRVTARTPYS